MDGYMKAKYKATIRLTTSAQPEIIYSNDTFTAKVKDGFLVITTLLEVRIDDAVHSIHAWPVSHIASYRLDINK